MEKKIIKIKKAKKKTILIFDDDSKLELNPNVLASYPLYINKIINEKLFDELKAKSNEEDLYVFASQKIALKEFTTGKMKKLLKKKGAKEKEIGNILQRLICFGLINEDNIVEDVLDRSDIKHFGYKKTIQKLYDLKISKVEINKVKYDRNREIKHAKILIEKLLKKYASKNNVQLKKSCFDALLRNGYSPDVALELVNKIPNSNNNHEINVLKLDYAKAYEKYRKRYKGNELVEKVESSLVAKGYCYKDIKYVEELNT